MTARATLAMMGFIGAVWSMNVGWDGSAENRMSDELAVGDGMVEGGHALLTGELGVVLACGVLLVGLQCLWNRRTGPVGDEARARGG